MSKMTAVAAAVRVLEKEGVTTAFGVPGAAIKPLYAALRAHRGIRHILARHVEGASHMADGYSRAMPDNIGVCIGTSGPAGTDMITGLYAAQADSIPILCLTGQAPRAAAQRHRVRGDLVPRPVADAGRRLGLGSPDQARAPAGGRTLRDNPLCRIRARRPRPLRGGRGRVTPCRRRTMPIRSSRLSAVK
jgi:hypothetical protein